MIIRTEADVTPAVLAEIARAPDPRLREIMSALVRHLHGFAREVKLPEADEVEGEAVPRIEAQRPGAGHQAFDELVGGVEEVAIGFEHGDMTGLAPQRAL